MWPTCLYWLRNCSGDKLTATDFLLQEAMSRVEFLQPGEQQKLIILDGNSYKCEIIVI